MTFCFQYFITYFCVYVNLCVGMCVIYFCVYVYLCVGMCGQSIPGRSWFPRPIPWSPRDWTQGVRLGAFLYPLTHACHWPFLSSFGTGPCSVAQVGLGFGIGILLPQPSQVFHIYMVCDFLGAIWSWSIWNWTRISPVITTDIVNELSDLFLTHSPRLW